MKKLFYIKIAFFISLFFGVQNIHAQKEENFMDSLNSIIKTSTDELEVIKAKIKLSNYQKNYRVSYWDSLAFEASKFDQNEKIKTDILYGKATALMRMYKFEEALPKFQKCVEEYQKLEVIDERRIAEINNDIGYIEYKRGNAAIAIENCEKSLVTANKLKYSKLIIHILGNLSMMYSSLGDTEKGLELTFEALDLSIKEQDSLQIANLLNNVGFFYANLEDDEEALAYMLKSMKIKELMPNYDLELLADGYWNIGSLMHKIGDTIKYKENLQKAAEVYKKLDNPFGLGSYYYVIATIAQNENKHALTVEYFTKSIVEYKKAKYYDYVQRAYAIVAKTYLKMNDLKKAKNSADSSYYYAINLDYPPLRMNAYNVKYLVYNETGEYKKALENYQKYTALKDSLDNSELESSIIKKEANYTYEKQKALDKAENDKKLAIERAQQEKQKIIIYATIGGLVLVVVFLLFVYNRLQLTRKQKIIIEETNEELNQTNEELAAQRDEIENQKNKVEKAHKEIKDSINYAKRIQDAILPPLSEIKEVLPQSFVLYQPKDVVAGDFYWMEATSSVFSKGGETSPLGSRGRSIYIAAADCTGHGVPGAMVSVVCSNALTKAVLEDGITDVGKILDRTREIVIAKLAKSGDVRDGMDISLACFDFDKMKLEWAGANNPLYLLRYSEENTGKESKQIENSSFRTDIGGVESEFSIEITKGDREPIGYTENPTPFTTHTFDLQKGDTIYLFTDGYADQFGEVSKKKMGQKKFRQKLFEISSLEMNEQETQLKTYFAEWKGVEEQIDDVCVIGVRV